VCEGRGVQHLQSRGHSLLFSVIVEGVVCRFMIVAVCTLLSIIANPLGTRWPFKGPQDSD